MDVRKQFIIRAIEIWLFITNRGSAFKHRFYTSRGETFYGHPEAIPIPLNLRVEVIGYIEQLVGIGCTVGKTINFIGGGLVDFVILHRLTPKGCLNQMEDVRVVTFLKVIVGETSRRKQQANGQ